MYRKKKKKAWIWILIGLIVILVAGGLVYYKEVVMAAEASEEEEIVLEENQEWKYFKITQILGNEMTAAVVQEDGEETTESGTWMIPVGTEVVTKLGTTTTFARLASGDTIKVLMQNEDDGTQDILKIWIVDLTQTSNGAPDMQGAPGEDGAMPGGDNMMAKTIEIEHVNKGYMLGEEKVPVLRDINFEVEEGEFVAILGPSGSGKTTLMNIIGCMDILDSGEYYLHGRAIHEMEEKDLTEVRNKEIGFIFQNYQLISTYNVMQNIIMPLLIRRMGTSGKPVKNARIS